MAMQRLLSADWTAAVPCSEEVLRTRLMVSGLGRRILRLVVVGLLGVGLALLVGMQVAWAQDKTRTVPTSPGCETIQSCVETSDAGDTIEIQPGEYRENVTVDKDLTIKGTDCDDSRRVIVDAQPGGMEGVGFTVDADGVRIRCLLIRNGDNGIQANDSNDLSLDRILVEGTSSDSIEVTGNRFQMERSRLLSSGDNGLDVSGDRVRISKVFAAGHDSSCINITGARANVDGSRFERCEDGDGTEIDGDESQVSGNTVIASDGGIDVGGADPRITGNTVTGAGDDGFVVDCNDRCKDGLVEGNTATVGSDDSIGFDISSDATGLRILNNTASDNVEDGFELDTTGAVVRGNTAERNGSEDEHGFEIFGDDNLFEENRAVRNEDDGFNIEGNNNVFRGNHALSNSKDGFDLENSDTDDDGEGDSSSNNRLRLNVAIKNRAEGIENNGLLTDVVGNQASRNRTDCANDGTIDENRDNECADGSDFNKQPRVD